MSTRSDTLQKRHGIVMELEKMTSRIGGRQWTAEERKTFDDKMAEVDRLGRAAQIGGNNGRSLEQIIADNGKPLSAAIIENIGAAPRAGGGIIIRGKDGLENRMLGADDSFIDGRGLPADMELSDFRSSLGRMLVAKVRGRMEDLNPLEERALAEGAMAGGGFLAPVQTSQEIWQAARVNMVTGRAGVRFMDMQSKELDLIRQDADAVASWTPEGTTISESTAMAFSRLKLNLKKVAVIVNVNKELVLDSPNAASVVSDSINFACAKALDYAVLYGTGAGDQPQGLYYDSTITGVTDLAGAQTFTFDNAIDATYAILANNCPSVNGLAMLMAPIQKKTLDRQRGNDGSYLIGDVSKIPNSVNWDRCLVTQQISGTAGYPGRDIFIGTFDQFLIGAGQQVEILNTEYTSDQWSKYQVSFRAVLRADCGCMRPSWFYIYKNAA
jgi:HK97 family phage major capsid protein